VWCWRSDVLSELRAISRVAELVNACATWPAGWAPRAQHGRRGVVRRPAAAGAAACSFFVGDGYEDIGVVTDPAHRGLALSAACAAELRDDIQRRGHQPTWTTATDHRTSLRVAAKLGFVVHQPRRDILVGRGLWAADEQEAIVVADARQFHGAGKGEGMPGGRQALLQDLDRLNKVELTGHAWWAATWTTGPTRSAPSMTSPSSIASPSSG